MTFSLIFLLVFYFLVGQTAKKSVWLMTFTYFLTNKQPTNNEVLPNTYIQVTNQLIFQAGLPS